MDVISLSIAIFMRTLDSQVNNGTPKIKALIAISRKLLRIIFALDRDNAQYEENYYRKHEFKLAV